MQRTPWVCSWSVLFLLYINELCNTWDTIIFANDTNLFASDKNINTLFNKASLELQKIMNGVKQPNCHLT